MISDLSVCSFFKPDLTCLRLLHSFIENNGFSSFFSCSSVPASSGRGFSCLWLITITMVGRRPVPPKVPFVLPAVLFHVPPFRKRKCRSYVSLLFLSFFFALCSVMCTFVLCATTIDDGFFPVVSREVAAANRKKRIVIHNREMHRICRKRATPGA